MLALIKNDQVIRFPYSLDDLHREFPGTIVAQAAGLPLVLPFGTLVEVEPEAMPVIQSDQVVSRAMQPSKNGDAWVLGWDITTKSAAQVAEDQAAIDEKARKDGNAAVDAEADRRIEAGSSFTVSWQAAPIPMTGRPKDQSAILGLFGKAQFLKAAGATAANMVFRDADNHNHTLTPDQMLELCGLGMGWIELVRSSAWTLKDDAKAAGTPIPADYADDKYWPS